MLRHFNILISNICQSGTKNYNQSVSESPSQYLQMYTKKFHVNILTFSLDLEI